MEILDILNDLGIKYEMVEHKKVTSAEQSQFIKTLISGVGAKNLFLKHKNAYYLVLIDDSKKADLKMLTNLVNVSHLEFASPKDLEEILNVEIGSVTPLGIINDKDNLVTILIDKTLSDKKILMHPNVNTKTISMNFADLIRFIEYTNHKYLYL